MFEELAPRPGRPPRNVVALRLFGFLTMGFVALVTATNEPRPALSGDGRWVALSLAALLPGLGVVFPRRRLPPGVRLAGLVAVAASSCALSALQPDGPAITGVYIVVIVGALRLQRVPALVLSALTMVAATAILLKTAGQPAAAVLTLVFSILPWFLVLRLIREIQTGRDRAEGLVEELHESRSAHAQSAALAERSRLARDMHDVLAHSLSSLALQLEATRLLARDRDADPEVVGGVERAHHLAAGGLEEARRAIAALRGDELPGPERLQALAEAFAEDSAVRCRLIVSGVPHELPSEARLAMYRTAQEALTNVRRHSAADAVELRLAYAAYGTTLVVEDHGAGAPALLRANGGGGYGLTGMRERAELLGGRLSADPTDDGFRVTLWLPA